MTTVNFEKTPDNILTREEKDLLRGITMNVKREAEEKKRVEYLKESIRVDIEAYRDLLNEERELYRELSMTLKKLEENVNDDEYLMDLIEGIRYVISKNVDVQIEVLDNIRRNQTKL